MRIIAGACKGRSLKTVTGPGYRPAMGKVRESLFSMLEARGVVWSGIRALDLFAGSGSLGFEALSRGAIEAVFVEQDAKAATCLAANARMLGVEERCRILEEDALRVATRRPAYPFEIIFVDPPYAQALFAPTLKSLLRREWLAPEGFLIAEVEKHQPVPTPKELKVETDRLYGQTHIVVWTRQEMTPEERGSCPQTRQEA